MHTVPIRWTPSCFGLCSGCSYTRLTPKSPGRSIAGPTSDIMSFLSRWRAHVLWPAESVFNCAQADNEDAKRGTWVEAPRVSSLKSVKKKKKKELVQNREKLLHSSYWITKTCYGDAQVDNILFLYNVRIQHDKTTLT